MTEKEVQDTANAHLRAQLIGDYPQLVSNTAFDKASRVFVEGKPITVMTPHSYGKGEADEDMWEFVVEFSAGVQPDKNKTIAAAIEADRVMRAKVQAAFNDDANYVALRDSGLLMAHLKALPEDQRDDNMINPHLLTFRTY